MKYAQKDTQECNIWVSSSCTLCKDLSDKTQSSATYDNNDIDFTMMYPESHLELVTTGSAHVESNQSANNIIMLNML